MDVNNEDFKFLQILALQMFYVKGSFFYVTVNELCSKWPSTYLYTKLNASIKHHHLLTKQLSQLRTNSHLQWQPGRKGRLEGSRTRRTAQTSAKAKCPSCNVEDAIYNIQNINSGKVLFFMSPLTSLSPPLCTAQYPGWECAGKRCSTQTMPNTWPPWQMYNIVHLLF